MANATFSVKGGDRWQKALDVLKRNRLGMTVGVQGGATNRATGQSVATYAYFNEFGADSIPSRPFMRKTLEEKRVEWAKILAEGFKGRSTSRGVVQKALDTVGVAMVGDIVRTIKSNLPPPNSPETLRRKNAEGAGKGTLIDTGSLIKAISHVVKQM